MTLIRGWTSHTDGTLLSEEDGIPTGATLGTQAPMPGTDRPGTGTMEWDGTTLGTMPLTGAGVILSSTLGGATQAGLDIGLGTGTDTTIGLDIGLDITLDTILVIIPGMALEQGLTTTGMYITERGTVPHHTGTTTATAEPLQTAMPQEGLIPAA